ncbi:hypothetical protein RN629_02600 [Sphingomonadaceae bacterium jetA1]
MTTTERRPVEPAAGAPAIIFEAIVKMRAVSATYNRGDVVLAPHVIYTRHDELYVDATTVERDGKPPREEKLGTFKLAGLGALRLTPRRFTISELLERGAERYQGVTLMMVDDA